MHIPAALTALMVPVSPEAALPSQGAPGTPVLVSPRAALG